MIGKNMPSRLYRTVRQMHVGESAYTVPWSLLFYSDDRRTLWANTPIYKEAQGFSNMLVTRTEDGFIVDLTNVEHTWEVRTPEELTVIDVINN